MPFLNPLEIKDSFSINLKLQKEVGKNMVLNNETKKIVYSNLDLLFEKLEDLNKKENDLKNDQKVVFVDISKIKETNTKRED